MIRIEKLRKAYDSKTVALDSIDLTFEDSSFVALLGPSGCGKTTTLNCIAGLLEPTSGKIYFGDKDVTMLQPKDRNIGMVFQSYALYPHLKVIDNIAFPLKQKGMGKEERYAKVREIAKMMQIEALLERKPGQLSGGQQQRVSMARALVKEPEVLLLDEPMSNLDARLKIEIRDEIRRLQQETGITSIIVTHDQEEAMAIADKIAILDNGRIQQYDTPERLYHYPANLFVAKFMGNPPMNFIDAALTADGTHIVGAGVDLMVPEHMSAGAKKFAGKAIKIGVRSHLIAVETEKQPQTMEMRLQIVENLGKELLVSGMVGESFVRVTVPESHEMYVCYRQIAKSEKPYVYLRMTGVYNIFDSETGVNIGLEK
ncbi:MAG: ABC transporter ATP-binding protein [Clostridia bacterium]|nr:ABC transporter ATP-binding protein [Clostridia bacterium]